MEHGSIEMDLVNRASHDHGLFRDDSAAVYYKIEETTRGTQYADSIKPFQKSKNGRDAFVALSMQYAGADKWEAQLKKMTNLLHTRGAEVIRRHLLLAHKKLFFIYYFMMRTVQYNM